MMLDISFFLLGLNVNAFNGASPGGDWPLVLDFKNGSYTSATTTYTLADVWVPDSDWGNGGDLSRVVAGQGIVCDQELDYQSFRFSALFTQLVEAGPICVYDFNVNAIADDGSGIAFSAYEAVGYTYERCRVYNNGFGLDWYDGISSPYIDMGLLANGNHKIAILLGSGKISASIDGAAITELATNSPLVFPRVAVEIKNSNPGHSVTLHSAAFRDPAEGQAALPTLSTL